MTPYRLYDAIVYDVIAGLENIYVNNFSHIEVEPRSMCHCVCLVKTHRLICSMPTWVIYQVRSFDMTQGQIFKLTYRGQNAYVSIRLDERNTMVFRVFLSFLPQKIICKKK